MYMLEHRGNPHPELFMRINYVWRVLSRPVELQCAGICPGQYDYYYHDDDDDDDGEEGWWMAGGNCFRCIHPLGG